MRPIPIICLTMLVIALLGGCEKKEGKQTGAPQPGPQTPPPVTQTPATQPAGTAVAPATQPATQPTGMRTTPADATAREADNKLEQVVQYIKQRKFDLAEDLLKQLEGVKGSLPQALQTRIDSARTALTTAKAAVENLPKIPGL